MILSRKRKRFFAGVIVLFVCSVAYGQTKEICFTIDDLPVVTYGERDTASQGRIFTGLRHSLTANRIPAIGFVNETKLYDSSGVNSFQVGLLASWVDNGLEVGNHSFSHPDFNSVSCAAFFDDILKGERISQELLARKGGRLRYFRHPFLHVGNTRAKADSLERFLALHGYQTAPVTVDNDDYLFARAYAGARSKNDSLLVRKIGSDYLAYMEAKLRYFERQANALFGRDIGQILLIHASLLNAEYIDSLAAMCRRNGYRFASIDRVLEDQAYRTPVTVFGNWGISWIDRWAMSHGKRGKFFAGDPEVPEYIRLMVQD